MTTDPADLEEHIDAHFGPATVARDLHAPGTTYLLALIGTRPVGFVKLRDGEAPVDVPAVRALELSQAYVLPDAQRGGVGGSLLESAADLARGRRTDGLWLSVWEKAPWAIGAYEKHGFSTVGTTDFRIGRAAYTDLLMWRAV